MRATRQRFTDDDIRELRGRILSQPLDFPSQFRSWLPGYVGMEGTFTQSQLLNASHQPYTPTLHASVDDPVLGSGGFARGFFLNLGLLVNVMGTVAFGGSGFDPGTGNYLATDHKGCWVAIRLRHPSQRPSRTIVSRAGRE